MRILIVKSSALGDIIQSFPALSYLRTEYPHATIDWVVEESCADLIKAHPDIAEPIIVATRRWRKNLLRLSTWKEIFHVRRRLRSCSYDKIFDLQGNTKSAFFTLWARGKEKTGFAWSSVPEKPNWFVTNRHIVVAPDLPIQERYLKLVGGHTLSSTEVILKLTPAEETRLASLLPPQRPCYMVAMGSKWPNKQPSFETLKELLHKISPYLLLIYSNSQEKALAEALHQHFPQRSRVIGDLSLPLWQALMRQVDLVLAVDSAALHLCALTKTPSLSLFGPTNPAVYKPPGSQHRFLRGPCPYGRTFVHRCPVLRTCPTGACIHSITADQIVLEIK